MFKSFEKYLKADCQIGKQHKLLVACSGGVDSMVLATLLVKAGIYFELAHCNFQLRGDESNADEALVKDWANRNNIVFHAKKMDVKAEKISEGSSTQMAARKLRYDWFDELLRDRKLDVLATAHHLNDSVETVLINLSRGTGPKGLQGISPKSGNVVRPLMCFTKPEVLQLATNFGVVWREDKSNQSDDYKRNRIRHHVLPKLEEENEAFWKNAQNTLQRQADLVAFSQQKINTFLDEMEWPEKPLKVEKLKAFGNLRFLLSEILSSYGFNYSVVQQIEKSIQETESKDFYSSSWRLNLSQGLLQLISVDVALNVFYTANNVEEIQMLPFVDSAKLITVTKDMDFQDVKTRCFDIDAIVWPLTFRVWQAGDKMQPLGMTGYKLVSDILTNEKVSKLTKEKTLVMISANQILWVLNVRVSNKCKVNTSTKSILSIKVK